MAYQEITHIDASPERVWAVLAEVQRWPEWMPTVTRIEPLGPAELALGHAYRLKQPRLREAVWRVIELDPGRSFTWESRVGTVTTVGLHRIDPNDGVAVSLGIRHHGLLAPLAGALMRPLVGRYLRMEGRALRERCT